MRDRDFMATRPPLSLLGACGAVAEVVGGEGEEKKGSSRGGGREIPQK